MRGQNGDWESNRSRADDIGNGGEMRMYGSGGSGREPSRLETHARVALWAILLTALSIELLVRPFWPGLLKSEASYIGDIARLLLGLIGGGYGGGW